MAPSIAACRAWSLWARPLRPAADKFNNAAAKRFRGSDGMVVKCGSSASPRLLPAGNFSQAAPFSSKSPPPVSNGSASHQQQQQQQHQPAIFLDIQRRGQDHEVATIQVSNAAKMNIVNSRLLQDLVDTCQSLAKRDSLRAVVLTGAPTAAGKAPSFIGGADIAEMNALTSAAEARTFITRIHDACQAFRNIPVPVIAKVNGFSLGAGLEIMAACDLRLATSISKFAMPETKVGIPSVVEAALLPGLIGMGRARRFLYLAETLSASDAMEWGLVEKVVDDEGALDTAVNDWIDTLVSLGPKAVRAQKKLMASWENASVDEGIQLGIDAFAEAYEDGGQEPKEYMGKFLNRKR